MRLLPQLPEPFAASRFAQDAEGWQLTTWPGDAAPTPAQWTALDDGGAVAFTVPAGDTTTFFAAPTAFLGARSALAGGFVAVRLAAGAGATLRAGERGIVLVGGSASVALDVSAAGLAADEDGTTVVRAPLVASAGWTDASSGAAAGDDLLRAVVADLRALLVSPRILAPAEGVAATAELRAAEAYADPGTVLRPAVMLAYADGELSASWAPSPFAAAYRVRVRDAAGTERLAREIAATEFHPPVVLRTDDWQPRAGEAYTVEVAVLGPSAGRTVTPVVLPAPVPTATSVPGGVTLAWASVAEGALYDARVRPAAGGDPVAQRTGVPAAPLTLGEADGLRAATDYRAQVRAVQDISVGPWSDPVAFRVLSADDVLRQLLDRLVRNRPAPGTLSLDGTSLPAGAPGAPDRVLAVLRDALGADALAVAVPSDPVVADGALVLAGTADAVGAEGAAVRAEFTVDDGLALRLTLRVDLPAGWTMADAFAELLTTPFAAMPLMPVTLYVTTWAHTVDGVPVPLQPGLNLAATYTITADLRVAEDPTAPGMVPIAFGGAVRRTPSLQFALAGAGSLPDLTVNPLDRDPLVFTGGTALLSCAVEGGTATATAELAGRTTVAGQTVDATVELPTLGVPSPTLRTVEGALSLPMLSDAVAQVAGSLDTAPLLPPALLHLAG
ncbi:MAG TPA: hypothetical protein VM759_05455, partial [Longimicrobium sp.]|nr:hypothetical protein [Longimicrobium sp.]